WITNTFGWYYMILVTIIILFSLFLIFSPIGKLKLGKPNDEPEFKTISWLAMLFSAGMGIGLVFYGASEPISHYLMPPSSEPETKKSFMESISSQFSIMVFIHGQYMELLHYHLLTSNLEKTKMVYFLKH